MERHAAHRHVAIARGQHQVEQRRRALRVRLEHLVEVAHAEEQERVPGAPLQLAVLAHHLGLGAAPRAESTTERLAGRARASFERGPPQPPDPDATSRAKA
jgi:hypothetical protein